nr:MAG TPA: hypothetical protein [Caudoviricetes sp.]
MEISHKHCPFLVQIITKKSAGNLLISYRLTVMFLLFCCQKSILWGRI